jgi:hypothetical protein
VTSVAKAALQVACDYLMANAEIKTVTSAEGLTAAIPYDEKDTAAFEAAVLYNVLTALHKTEK